MFLSSTPSNSDSVGLRGSLRFYVSAAGPGSDPIALLNSDLGKPYLKYRVYQSLTPGGRER